MGKDEHDGVSRQRRTTRQVETPKIGTDSTYPLSTLEAGDSGSWQKKSKSKDTEGSEEKMDLTGDRTSVALLMFLYILQGIPLGLAGSIPMVLQSRKISYKEQALFSFVYWPFSIKLLWAPIVDAVYVGRFGRRKSWLVPTQYLIGLFMIVLSGYIPMLLGETDENAKVNIVMLTAVFFMLNFLAATQDIAVDGWALTMLSRLVESPLHKLEPTPVAKIVK